MNSSSIAFNLGKLVGLRMKTTDEFIFFLVWQAFKDPCAGVKVREKQNLCSSEAVESA